ncbi:ABC transporter substrate-binding protein, partial [Bordetella holmesii]
MRSCNAFLLGLALMAAGSVARAQDSPPIRLGEVQSMVADKEFAQGWRMALEDINQAGGVLGRPVQVVPIKIAPGAPVPNVIALFDPEPDSAQALLTSRQAAAWQLPYLVVRAPSDRLVWQEGNRYTFRLAPSSRMRIAALAPRALALRQTRWALVHAASQDGQEQAASFAATLAAFQARHDIVSRQAVTAGQVNADLMRALQASHTQALLVALRGQDLITFSKLVLQLPTLQQLPAIILHGEDLPDRAPAGWIVATHGALNEQDGFAIEYGARMGHPPNLAALQGYVALHSLVAALRTAQSADPEKLTDAFEGLRVDSAVGPILYRKADHQSTMGLSLGV